MAKPFKRAGQTYYAAEIWVAGKRYPIRTKCTSKREAQNEVDRQEAEIRGRLVTEADAMTSLAIGDIRDRYVALVATAHKGKEKTILECDRIAGTPDGKKTGFFPRSKLISEITHQDALTLREWRRAQTYGKKVKRPVGVYSINDTIEQLKKLFTFMKDQQVRLPNEPKWLKIYLEEPKVHVRELADDEADRLDAAIDAKRPDLRPLCDYAALVAKRKTESFTLRWDDVKWDRGVIETIGKGGRLHITEIDKVVRGILWPLWMAPDRHPDFVFTRVAQRTCDKVIKGKRYCEVKGMRHPWNKDSLRGAWNTVRDVAGLRYGASRFRWHDYRHDYASKALRLATDASGIKIVQETLGHARVDITLNTYSHLSIGAVSNMREKIAEQRRAARSDENRDGLHVTDHVNAEDKSA